MPSDVRDRRPDPEPPLVPGYTLRRLLGRGGSGEVWEAEPRGGGDAVAIKVLVTGDPERQAREAALLGELDHPHLIRLHEVVHQPSRGGTPRVALVLDLLPGGNLSALLARRRRLRPGEVVTALAPVAAALAHAHAHGVVHGDLSPGNVLFTAEGRPVLTDLGVARVLGDAASGEVTPAYVDPTVARGGAPGPASDVFGVAAAAFHALTGVPPWNAAGPAETLAVAAAGQLPDLAELAGDAPAELLEVIARGLAADPGARGSAAAFALDLRHSCRPEPVRLPAGGRYDGELGRTGAGPRTELTHQLPGRRPRPAVGAGPSANGARRRGGRRARSAATGAGRWDPRRRPTRAAAHRASSAAPAGGGRSPGLRRAVRVLVIPVLFLTLATAGWCGVRASWPGRPAIRPVSAQPTAVGAGAPSGPASAPESSSGTASGSASALAVPAGSGGAVRPADRQASPATPEEWRALLQDLYDRRAQAFRTGAAALLGDVYTPDSAELGADVGYAGTLRAAGQELRGFAPKVEQVTEVTGDGDRRDLEVVDSWGDYQIAGRDGPPVRALAGRPAASAHLVLVRSVVGWRIERAQRHA